MPRPLNVVSYPRPWQGLYGQLIVVAVLLLSAGAAIYPLKERVPQQIRLNGLERRISLEQARRESLQEDIKMLRGDPGHIERVARGNLGLVKQGEAAYVVLERPAPTRPRPKKVRADSLFERVKKAIGQVF